MSDNDKNETVAAERNTRPLVIGTVVSDKMDKTIVVRRDRRVKHPLYKKYMRRSTRLTAHDEENTAHLGDEVQIVQTRPLSKTKRWRLVRVLREAPRGDVVTGVADAVIPDDEPALAAAETETAGDAASDGGEEKA